MANFYLSWFPGSTEENVLVKIQSSGLFDGLEIGHVDDDIDKIKAYGLGVSLHLPFIKDENPRGINLADDQVTAHFSNPLMKAALKKVYPRISMHLGYSAVEVKKQDAAPNLALSPTLSEQETFQRMSRNIQIIKQLTHTPVIVENLDYGKTGALEYVCKPSFIGRFCTANKVGFLFDVSHAEISAHAMRTYAEDYVKDLAKRVRRITRAAHVNSHKQYADTHDAVNEKTIELLKTFFGEAALPELVVVERRNHEKKEPTKFLEEILKDAELVRKHFD